MDEERLEQVWNWAVENIDEDVENIHRDYEVNVNDVTIYFELHSNSIIKYYSQPHELYGLLCAKKLPEGYNEKKVELLETFEEFKHKIEYIADNAPEPRKGDSTKRTNNE